ncbi:hypothetical protein ABT236_20975 [Streptomyces sp. NPDC001523]|uniref:hypothetical protein n=1 Tax=Streptomyces sp. NPDC001523 TaxID=3154383 RepID=UPI00332ED4E3
MNTTPRRIAATFAVTAALVFLTATPSDAATARRVDSQCGTYICVHTAHHNRFVQDITVQTKDGVTGTLRAYWGNYHSSRVNAASRRWEVGYEQAGASLVCGGLERDGRSIEDGICVTI